MYLLSQNNLETNQHASGTINAQVKGVMLIEHINLQVSLDINMQFQYLDAATEQVLYSSTKTVTEDEQQTLYQAVKNNLPNIDDSYSVWYQTLLYEAFRQEMASRYGIPTTEIDIIL